jgi:hypothetical protein
VAASSNFLAVLANDGSVYASSLPIESGLEAIAPPGSCGHIAVTDEGIWMAHGAELVSWISGQRSGPDRFDCSIVGLGGMAADCLILTSDGILHTTGDFGAAGLELGSGEGGLAAVRCFLGERIVYFRNSLTAVVVVYASGTIACASVTDDDVGTSVVTLPTFSVPNDHICQLELVKETVWLLTVSGGLFAFSCRPERVTSPEQMTPSSFARVSVDLPFTIARIRWVDPELYLFGDRHNDAPLSLAFSLGHLANSVDPFRIRTEETGEVEVDPFGALSLGLRPRDRIQFVIGGDFFTVIGVAGDRLLFRGTEFGWVNAFQRLNLSAFKLFAAFSNCTIFPQSVHFFESANFLSPILAFSLPLDRLYRPWSSQV